MNRILVIVALAMLPAIMNAQESQSSRSYQAPGEKVMPYVLGNGQTSDGEFDYRFETPPGTDYTVVFTPLSDNTGIYIFEKRTEGFKVRTSNGEDATFDFVVFVRKVHPKPSQTD